ncbi:hypothetical protein GLOTRDRAFT_110552 [Gloeophyllum trabeum ATCC 11539]|uniref:DUF1746 domain-containing protein n=1 Tax=Gloeophyllum trabeum (strain ATCC 11539 / FP-39264 / Madison 617) TaxID=670483 RepID=S7QDI7_GLOTA|nr:uncharacterized protein GLOTRDRAFT_110552 [Gloeophyllum trabeum ATCC 11539]EPQ57392.1 hypothetical protein GLOTRDRAFT_110552 [Gloeophyllum trabeum ATCC 11539]
MRIRYYAQRQHIIQSLDTLLYQLFTLSFFLSPRVWPLICRSATQFQFSRPRDLDPKRSLRFWFFLILLFNAGSIWSHAAEGAAVGRAAVLDFVGMAHVPNKLQLLSLDFLIVLLQMALTTIAYETSYIMASPDDTPDPLLPSIAPSATYSLLPTAEDASECASPLSSSIFPPPPSDANSKPPESDESPYIIELRLSTVIDRIRRPPPPAPEPEDGLPMPNVTPAGLGQLPDSLQRIVRARAARMAARRRNNEEREAEPPSRVPGGLGDDDGG